MDAVINTPQDKWRIYIIHIEGFELMKTALGSPAKVISIEQNFSHSSAWESGCLEFDLLYWSEIVSSALREDPFSGSCFPSPSTVYSLLLVLQVEKIIGMQSYWERRFLWHVAYEQHADEICVHTKKLLYYMNSWLTVSFHCCLPWVVDPAKFQTIYMFNYMLLSKLNLNVKGNTKYDQLGPNLLTWWLDGATGWPYAYRLGDMN